MNERIIVTVNLEWEDKEDGVTQSSNLGYVEIKLKHKLESKQGKY